MLGPQSVSSALLVSPLAVACRDRFTRWRAVREARKAAGDYARLLHIQTALQDVEGSHEPSTPALQWAGDMLRQRVAASGAEGFRKERHRLRVVDQIISAEVDRIAADGFGFVRARRRRQAAFWSIAVSLVTGLALALWWA